MLIQGVTDYAIFMLDANGRVSTWNAGAERIKGYSAAEIIGSPYARFYTPEDVAAGEPERALATAKRDGKYEKEGWRVRKNGERFWASTVLDAIRDEDGTFVGYAKVTRDITERRQAQIELQQAREALFQAQKMEAVGQLTAGIAHDFNNMLAGVIGSLDLLRTRIKAQRYGDAERYIETAIASAERAAALTARLLAFGRRQPLDVKPVDLNAVVASLQELLGRTMGERIGIVLALDPALPYAETDAHQLENAIVNLAINARDAMPDGGTLTLATSVTAKVTGSWRGTADGPFVTLDVSDTGHGMTPEILSKAFDPFFTTKPLGQGTGLGLSMIYGFAKQSRGHLLIASDVGSGTKVSLHLPISPCSPAAAGETPARRALPHRDGETVLVVEDDENVRMLVLDVVSDLGFHAIGAQDGPSALPLLEGPGRIDLMVSDIGLPNGMNGRALAEAARVQRPDLPILFITGYAAEAAREGFLGAGMDLMMKPFSIDALGARIRALMPG
ncbi:PAS domain S-box protein [Aquabacter spiritensis]|uniref:histidine kinase n=1 Tax=Aquabacter spiritensis TaxID=933073 RepID=A0A4R3LWU9_9HYPH|nr:PAS domain S-box protein [Aquabacter spiritensis]TCT05101.1 PAS domain S-box-containing protein [Aquabacter spiritensis]